MLKIEIMFLKVLFFILLSIQLGYCAETCSRKAIVNYQEILVDGGSNKKGEGLRFYLEKDKHAKELLDEYQQKNKPTILSASASTIGSFLIFSGLLQTSDSAGIENRNTLIYGGGILVALSYLISKTMQYNNEEILKRAVDQYNKRNLPRIYFSPYNNSSPGIGIGVQQDF